jgi:arabinose-5-phosphate isomerase
MGGNLNSFLAKQSDLYLNTTVEQESCPNNLAPTNSTTAQMVMGDALAVALSAQRCFLPEDFARFHPGGSLGRKLLTKVRDVMHRDLPIIISGASINDAIVSMTTGRLGVTLIMDKSHAIKGLFTDGDLRRALLTAGASMDDHVDNYMTLNPLVIDADVKLAEAESVMRANKIRCLVVTDTQTRDPVGLVEILDF